MKDHQLVVDLVPGTTTPTLIEHEFGPQEEEAIVSLALDVPDLFCSLLPYIDLKLFSRLPVRFVIAWIKKQSDQYNVIPTRQILHDQIARQLTADDPYEEVLALVDRPSNPRELPLIKKHLVEWARKKAYNELYSDEAYAAFKRGDYAVLQQYYESANKITDQTYRGLWLFDQPDEILAEHSIVHYTTGFQRLDEHLNDGGPSAGELLLWLAATGVGKTITLCNNAIACARRDLDVLFVTFELSAKKMARRCLGILSGQQLQSFAQNKQPVIDACVRHKATHRSQIFLAEFPPEECSVTEIYALLRHLRQQRGWTPQILCVDYLDLMLSRRQRYNDDDYTRQKYVASELRGLGINEGMLVFSATQTNRGGTSAADRDENVELNQMAESYAKGMPADYVVSLNQSRIEYLSDPPIVRFFIAKNREGVKFQTISCHINYLNMRITQAL